MKDSEIVDLFFSQKEKAISVTIDKYGEYCYSISHCILRNALDSEECLNDIWFEVWNRIPPERPTAFHMFLAKIARKIAFGRFRERSEEESRNVELGGILHELEDCLIGPDVDSSLRAKEMKHSINDFLKTVPARDGNVFLRRYFHADPIPAIAKRYGLTEANVRQILFRTRKKLKLYLEKEGYTV